MRPPSVDVTEVDCINTHPKVETEIALELKDALGAIGDSNFAVALFVLSSRSHECNGYYAVPIEDRISPISGHRDKSL